MLNILKKLVETKIGRTVKTRGDCQLISDTILESLDVEISYSTIKRVYGLNASTKSNTKTLYVRFKDNKNRLSTPFIVKIEPQE